MAERASRRFVQTFVLVVVGILLVVLLLNWIVDPYAYYGADVLPPLVDEPRRDKITLLDQFDPPPDALILGSSRVRLMDVGLIEQLSGYRTFNATLNQSIPADYLALTRYLIEKRQHVPRLLIVGLDIQAFAPDPWVSRDVFDRTPLALYVESHQPSRLNQWAERVQSALSLQQARDSLRLLRLYYNGNFEGLQPLYAENGAVLARLDESDTDVGSGPSPVTLAQSVAWHTDYFRTYDHLDQDALADFEAFLRLCDANDIQVILFFPPFHPTLLAHLQKNTSYPQRVVDLSDQLAQWSAKYSFTFYDFSDIASFGGSDLNFEDGYHANRTNMRRLTEKIFDGGVVGVF